MGYVASSIIGLKELMDLKILFPGASIIEFGAQEAHGNPEELKAAILDVAKKLNVELTLPTLKEPVDMSAIFRLLGFRHKAIDVNEIHGSQFFDLNTEQVADEDRGQYDWVNNEGTTEHVCNQLVALQAAHDYCKQGGYITHSVPLMGWVDHGLMNATPKFWAILSGENQYKIVRARVVRCGEPHPLPEWYASWERPDNFIYEDIWLHLILQKQGDKPFVAPLDHLEFDKDGTLAARLKESAARMQETIRVHKMMMSQRGLVPWLYRRMASRYQRR